MREVELFMEFGECSRFQIQDVIGRGRRSLVRAAFDAQSGERVAIKKISGIFEDVHDAVRILREIKLLRILRHPDIVGIKHIVLPSSPAEFNDIFIVFELMECDLYQVISSNEDLTNEHHQFFLYQILRALKYIHTANVIHRDLTPKNILANADCRLKIHNFSLARSSSTGARSALYWNDNTSTKWYRAPELCGSFFSKYSSKLDIWSIGCIFAELLTRKPLFPGKNMFHQLDLITNLLGTPSPEWIARVRSEKIRRYLSGMKKKNPIPFSQMFPSLDPLAVSLLERLLAFEPNCRPSAEEALAHPYFIGLANVDREPAAQPINKILFEFENMRLTKKDVRELIYREVLEYAPTSDSRKESQETLCDEIAQNSSENDSVEVSDSFTTDYKNRDDTTVWNSILEDADELSHLNGKSGNLQMSSAKTEPMRVLKGDKSKSKPRFSIRNLPTSHNILKSEAGESSETRAQEIRHKSSASSMTELLEELTRKNTSSSLKVGDSRHCSSSTGPSKMIVRRSKRKEKKTLERIDRSSTHEDTEEQVGSTTSSEEEENGEKPLIPATMADLFQEFFSISAADVEGVPPPTRSAASYSGRLQQITLREKDRHVKLLKQMQNSQLSGIDVKILSRVLDAKLIACRCLLYGKSTECIEMPEGVEERRERTVIFNPKMCGHVELHVENLIRICPPWKEVKTKEGDTVILCTYFCHIMP